MADLEACYSNPDTRERKIWRHSLPYNQEVTLGRTPKNPNFPDMVASDWVMEDKLISSQHAILIWKDGKLRVRRRMKPQPTTNQIYYDTQPKDDFEIEPGQSFIIGHTVFTLHSGETQSPPTATQAGGPPPTEMTIGKNELPRQSLIDSDKRLDVLRELADQLKLPYSTEQLEDIVLDKLLKGMVYADAVAIVMISAETADTTNLQVPVRRCKQRANQTEEFRPSRSLVYNAVCRLKKGVVHVWNKDAHQTNELSGPVTVMPRTDWAICVPLFQRSNFGWALYVTGRLPKSLETSEQIQSDKELKYYQLFTGLVGETFGSTQQISDLENQLQSVRRFLPSKVLTNFDPQNIEKMLQPRETEVTVLFCDIRGSCKFAEDGEGNLMEAWNEINEALQTMTEKIDSYGGVIADLQGDAAMGFWGWPFAEEDQIENAVKAALEINKKFTQMREKAREDAFECGIGLAHGKAVAGRLGTFEQCKVDVYGPVVNLAARLESMTKQFGVRVLVDENIAEYLRTKGKINRVCRTRKLARLYPAGMNRAQTVFELLPLENHPGHSVPEKLRSQWEMVVDMFIAKKWETAKPALEQLSTVKGQDKAGRMLLEFMAQHNYQPTPEWDGVIRLEKK